MATQGMTALGRSWPAIVAVWLASLYGSASSGYELEYSDERPASVAACDARSYRGQRAEATTCYAALLEDEDPRIRAEAARALGDLKSANSHFQTAIELYPEDPAVRTRWGELFLQTHQDAEAVKLFQEALELDPNYLPAKLGLAKVSAERFEQRARAWVDEVLEASPDDMAAHLLLARMELEEGALEAADESLDRALAIAQREDHPPLEVYALKASLDLLRGVTDSEWTQRALAYNPRYGSIYATPAHFYVITRRYRQAIELYRRAVEIQPDLYSAHAELGINLLRENRVADAQRHLTLAYRGDPYAAPVVNTLRLIDSFENFTVRRYPSDPQTAADPQAAAAAQTAEETGIILRLHQSEAEVIEPYVLDLVRRSIATFSERYGFEPQEPVVVELYPEHDDFAVRTSGLPGIGLLGVTFGYLVAMDSPSGRSANDFHWGTTLWHEMAHVFTLEATDHLVPRWFSEGISVFEEWSTGPLPGRHLPLNVLQAMREDKFLPLAELDGGFIRPMYPSQVIVSYMQAGLICQYIASRWGQEGLVRMLERFADGDTTEEAVQAALQLPADAFDQAFDTFIQQEFGVLLAGFDTWREQMGRAQRSAEEADWPGTLTAADEAIRLHPAYVDDGSPYLAKARAHDALGQRPEAMEALATYHRQGGHDPQALMRLAAWLEEAGRTEQALEVLRDVLMVAPLEETLHAQLGDRLLDSGLADQALVEYRALLAVNPHDRAAAHYRLARAYLALEDQRRGREHLLYALEIAPHYREAQQLLLEIVR